MIIPKDNICRFCKRFFCCLECRFKHEEKAHATEMKEGKELEKVQEKCNICMGQPFPLTHGDSEEILNHILSAHLPLKCGKCQKIFSSKSDFLNAEKCQVLELNECILESPINSYQDDNVFKAPAEKGPDAVAVDEDSLTPLSKINLRWRRKSRGFEPSAILDSASVSERQENKTPSPTNGQTTRTTSTPMPANRIINYTDSYNSTMQISSINYTSSTSSGSESDGCHSPPIPEESIKTVKAPSPNLKKSVTIQNKIRPKMPVQATPLRQVMSKSIQRALAQHGYYRQSSFVGLQQRKVCFDSTGSSTESTTPNTNNNSSSITAPLDLRTTPVLRRTKSESTPYHRKVEQEVSKENVPAEKSMSESDVIVAPAKSELAVPKSNTEEVSMDSYFSCPSVAQTNSENLIEETPKYVNLNGGLPKKAISFNTPASNQQTKAETPFEDDEVFYTPCATPVQRSYSCSAIEVKAKKQEVLKEDNKVPEKPVTRSSESNLWNLVSQVIRVASKKPDKPEELKEGPKHTFNFTKSVLLQKAASFAGFFKSSFKNDGRESEGPLAKRRRIVSNELPITSPLRKRQKIHGRKPIERMRNAS